MGLSVYNLASSPGLPVSSRGRTPAQGRVPDVCSPSSPHTFPAISGIKLLIEFLTLPVKRLETPFPKKQLFYSLMKVFEERVLEKGFKNI